MWVSFKDISLLIHGGKDYFTTYEHVYYLYSKLLLLRFKGAVRDFQIYGDEITTLRVSHADFFTWDRA